KASLWSRGTLAAGVSASPRSSTLNSHPHPLLQPETEDQTGDSSEPETDDSADWKETREPQSALNSLKHESRCKKTFSCSECGRRFGCKTNLRRHTRIHTGEKRFSCGFCNERFARRPQFQEHKCVGRQTEENREAEPPSRNSHPHTLVQPETDDSADSDFWKETRERLSRSNSLEDNDISGSNKALSCSDVRTSENPKPESGDSVDSDFWKDDRKPQSGLDSPNNSDGGSENEVRCDNPLRKPFGCPECGKRFLNLCNLKNHTKYHTGERAFFCSVCGLKCLYRSHLKIHMRTHTGEKPFPCPVCGKKFGRKTHLKTHTMTHTGEKPFSCSFCNTSFTQSGDLQKHMRVHTGEKPFSCSVCNTSFTQSENLRSHMRTHTGEKPFSCSECGRAFTERGNLKKHMMTHTGEKPFSCSVSALSVGTDSPKTPVCMYT
uniref:C2H2-type domain-containing protein n=1 Tax=Sander lucioperca TaxID=283035 RepID=A0A8D0CTH9_SANLU